ncbi:MAG: serine/threonine transporter SstT [Eggerthellaceae bacterium]
MKAIVKAWTSLSLIKRILIGLVIGALIGIFGPKDLVVISMLGTLFVNALKAIAPLLVFFLVVNALCRTKMPKSMRTIVILYVVATLCAAFTAVIASYIMPTELTLSGVESASQSAPSDIGEVVTTLLTNMVANPVDALVNANYLGILVWAIILGIALRFTSEGTRDFFSSMSHAVSIVVRWVIACAPFGIFGLIYTSVSQNGVDIFIEYGQLLIVLLGSMFFVLFIVYPFLSFLCIRKNPYPLLFRCIKDSGTTAFFTRSSAANIPVNMELCRRLGLSKDTYSVSIPLGATVNMGGAAVTITVMAMAAAHTMGIAINPLQAGFLCVLAAASACGASGVAGGSLLLIPLACSLFGISNDIAMQVVGVGFVIGVIQDSVETAINSLTDVLFTASSDYRERRKLGITYKPGKDDDEWMRPEDSSVPRENSSTQSTEQTA